MPALDTYTNFPSGVIAFQQLVVPRVGNRTKLFTLAVTLCWISDPQVRLHHLRYIRPSAEVTNIDKKCGYVEIEGQTCSTEREVEIIDNSKKAKSRFAIKMGAPQSHRLDARELT